MLRMRWQWWRQTSRMFRIGIIGCGLVCTALMSRGITTLLDDPANEELRERRASQAGWERELQETWDNGIARRIEHATDLDLTWIAENLPKIEKLDLYGGNFTSQGIRLLTACRGLKDLRVGKTEFNDECSELLVAFPKLESLFMYYTNITDSSIPVFERMPKLRSIQIQETALSAEAVNAWRLRNFARGTPLSISPTPASDENHQYQAVLHWSDGTIGVRYLGPVEILVERLGHGETSSNGRRENCGTTLHAFFSNRLISMLGSYGYPRDGDYHVKLRLGEIESAPVLITLKDDRPSLRRLEFQLAVTRAEAERMAANVP